MKTRSILRWLRLPLLSAAALLALAGTSAAQTISNWNGGGGDGNWSNAANWDVGPTSAFDTELVFSGAANLATVQNITSGVTPFQLTAITYDGTATTASISGAPLQFGPGTNPASINTASGTGRLLINTAVAFTSATTININSNNGNGAELFFGGPVTNPVGNTITVNTVPPGTLVLFTSANNTNFAGTWAQNASTLTQLGAHNAMWRSTIITMTGTCAITAGTTTAAGQISYGINDVGYNQQIGSISGSGQFLVGTTNSAATALVGFTNTSTTLSGSAGLAGFNSGSHFGKVGTGTLTVSNENASFNTSYSVRDGNLSLTGAKGSLTNSLAGTGPISVYDGTMLRANNTTAPTYGGTQGKLSDTADVRMVGGQLRFDGGSTLVALNGSSNSTLELLGSLRPFAGQSTVVVNAHANQPARFNFLGVNDTDLARGGMVSFVGTSLGAPPAPGISGVTFTNAPVTVNGVLPWAISQVSYVSNTTVATPNVTSPDALAILGPNGVAPLTSFTDNDFTSATQNVRVNVAATVTGLALANSLTIDSGSLTLGGGLTITSGAVMSRAPTATIDGTGPVSTSGRMYMSVSGSNVLTVTAPIQATGFSKGGSGTLSVGPMNVGTGIIQVNSGAMTFTAPPVAGVVQLSRSATVAGLPSWGGTLRGNGTVTGPLNMAPGSLIGGSSLASVVGGPGGTSGASPGTLNVSGPLSFTGGANTRLRFYMTSVFGGSYTQGLIVATSLDLTGVTPGAPVTVQPHSLALSNNDNAPVYDFDTTQNYTWTLIQTSNPVVGFDPSAFNVDLANFTNPVNGTFNVAVQGNNLVLNFVSSVPEPTLLGVAGLGLLAVVRLRRKA